MYYVFKDDIPLYSCTGEPDIRDIQSRGEVVVHSPTPLDINEITLVNGEIVDAPETQLSGLKYTKLEQIGAWTRQAIISGFTSTAKGEHTYDSTDEDQSTMRTMYIASQSPDFETHAIYHGQIPIRAVPVGQTGKVVLGHSKSEMQKLMDEMALHIGTCKQRGWTLQEVVATATTIEELELIKWAE